MVWEWPASPTCPPSGLGSTKCSDFLRHNRHSNRVSASRGLRFRETGFRGQRKMRRNDLPTVTMPSLRPRVTAYEKCLQHAIFLVVDLVRTIEAVIASQPFHRHRGREHAVRLARCLEARGDVDGVAP